MGLSAHVRILGFAPIEDFVGYLAACDIVLNLRYPTVGESSGTLLRSLGLGKAVMVSEIGSFAEFPEEVCLKVPVGAGEEDGRSWFAVDAAAETLALTTVGRWRHGARVNLERPLKFGDELGGHLVAGHVDGVAAVVAREDLTDMARFTLRAPMSLTRFIAPKGSVTLDGVSLTVNDVKDDTFSVLIIPHTLAVTAFGALRQDDGVNLEIDTMARYAARLMDAK